MTAAAWNSGRRTIVASRKAAVEEIVGQDERLRIARPIAAHAGPGSAGCRAISDTAVKAAAIVTLEEAQT